MTYLQSFCWRILLVAATLGASWQTAPAEQPEAAAEVTHWAYAPVRTPAIPPVKQTEWPRTPLDMFVLAQLESTGLTPSPAAEPAVLVRRLHLDLHGLPPCEDELAEFVANEDPAAYEQLVDRLMASPRFGQRFGRHWLDVVRFAESVTLRGLVLNEAWRYRDYVIESFHADRPYDEFLREQVAGDLLESSDADANDVSLRQRRLVATMFWALGNINLEEQDKRQLDMDVVDEQLDVLGKAVLAQTIGCARCHDHKFDPIPTRDYYALAGILRNTQLLEHANVSGWQRVKLPLPADEEARFAAQDSRLAALTAARDEARQQVNRLGDAVEGLAVLKPSDLPGIVVDDRDAKAVGRWETSQHSGRYIGAGFLHDLNQRQGEKTLTFVATLPHDGRYEVRLAYVAHGNRATNAQVTVFSAEGEQTILVNQRQPPPLDRRFISLGEFRFERVGQCYVMVANDNADGHVVADAVQFLPRDAAAAAADLPASSDPPLSDPGAADSLAAARRELSRLEGEVKAFQKSMTRRPAVLTLVERTEISDAPVHIGGSVHTLGETVPRGFLSAAVATSPRPMPAQQSGRRELADWLTATDNPLTGRVMANRVWHWLLGSGIVSSLDNFGLTGEPPENGPLLDHLASSFVADGWSAKRLVRQIVCSQTYRQSSRATQSQRQMDPENRYCGRAQRRPLEAEALRDAMLLVSGQLDDAMHGTALPDDLASDYGHDATHTRRSVYVPVLRNALPELFEAFDFADTSLTVGQRNRSVVVPQALYLLNSEFVRQSAQQSAERLLAETQHSEPDRVTAAFLRTLGRGPSDAERAVACYVLSVHSAAPTDALAAYTELFHLLFASLDFRWRD